MLTSDKNSLSTSYSIKLKDFLIYLFSLAIGIALLIHTFRGVSLEDIGEQLTEINFTYMTIFITMIITGTFLRALRWKYMILSFKENVKLQHLVEATIINYGVNVILPRMGEIARAIYLGTTENISRSSTLGTIIVERILDLIFLLASVVISLIIYGDFLTSRYPWINSAIYTGIIFLILSFLFLFLVIKFQNKVINWLEKFFQRVNLPFFNRASEITSKVIDGFDSIKTKKNYVITFLLSPLLWFIYALGSYFGLLALNMHLIQPVDIGSGLIIMSITTIGIMIPIPGSTGSYHAFCKSVLTMILGFNVKISLTYAVITHLLNTLPFVILSAIILSLRGFKRFIN